MVDENERAVAETMHSVPFVDHSQITYAVHATGDLLAYAVHAWSSALESYGESRVISLDISKAFDRFWHKGLLAKLPMFGLHHTLFTWISSFLSDGSFVIRVDGYLSKIHSINSISSIFGPLPSFALLCVFEAPP